MKEIKNKRIIILIAGVLVLLIVYFLTKPHINRLLDNRERAVMFKHGLLLEEKIQALARQDGAYPSEEKVKQLIQTSNFTSPHTHTTYDFIGGIDNFSQLKDSQMAYGLGDYQPYDYLSPIPDNHKAYFCIGIDMPRTNEGGGSCQTLNFSSGTDSRIKYALSCKTNWLGYSTDCDKSILRSL